MNSIKFPGLVSLRNIGFNGSIFCMNLPLNFLNDIADKYLVVIMKNLLRDLCFLLLAVSLIGCSGGEDAEFFPKVGDSSISDPTPDQPSRNVADEDEIDNFYTDEAKLVYRFSLLKGQCLDENKKKGLNDEYWGECGDLRSYPFTSEDFSKYELSMLWLFL